MSRRYTAAQVAKALREHGSASAAAKALGCAPGTVRDYARRYPSVAKALRESREGADRSRKGSGSAKLSTAARNAFLGVLRRSGNATLAAQAAGVGRQHAYVWRDRHPDFAAEWDAAIDEAKDLMEAEAWRRAMQGVTREKPHYYLGEEVGREIIREYSDTMLIFLLKAARPDKYRDRLRIDMNIMDSEAERLAEEFGLSKAEVLAEAQRVFKEAR